MATPTAGTCDEPTPPHTSATSVSFRGVRLPSMDLPPDSIMFTYSCSLTPVCAAASCWNDIPSHAANLYV